MNPNCRITDKKLLETADRFTTEYYGAKVNRGKKNKVCPDCRKGPVAEKQSMLHKLQSGYPCLPDLLPPPAEDTITLDDDSGDEDLGEEDSDLSEFEFELNPGPASHLQSQVMERLTSALESINFRDQIDQSIQVVEQRLEDRGEDIEEIDEAFDNIEKEIEQLRENLYKHFRPEIQEVPAVDLGITVMTNGTASAATLKSVPVPPPKGPLVRKDLVVDQEVFAVYGSTLASWKKGILTEVDKEENKYTVKFTFRGKGKDKFQIKVLSRRHLAYSDPLEADYPVGTRIIGLYSEEPVRDGNYLAGNYYPGIIAEPATIRNDFRYLIFFDDGYTCYLEHKNVRVVTGQSANVARDVHSHSRDFVKKYLSQYPKRPMVKTGIDQIFRVEYDGKWYDAAVLSVDASLVKVRFIELKRVETLYRGSSRMAVIYFELLRQKSSGKSIKKISFTKKPVARKSTAKQRAAVLSEAETAQSSQGNSGAAEAAEDPSGTAQSNLLVDMEKRGQVRPVDMSKFIATPMPFTTHECGPDCLGEDKQFQYTEKLLKEHHNPLLMPILVGWKREVTKSRNFGRRVTFYRAPCGRRMRNMAEVLRYLSLTNSLLEVDFFNFDWWTRICDEFVPDKIQCEIKDISYGKENVPVSCVNSLDNSFPEYVEYSSVKLPQKGVIINTEEGFLTCCDCTDGCRNSEKCSCRQLTIQSTVGTAAGTVNQDAGYVNRRLLNQVPTGIYECNSKCKCAQTCLNRVAQNPLRAKLQVFKTAKRGWGIRTLCDLPAGAFVCIYVGNLYTTEEGNTQGQNFGDEYFAELDLIEAVERYKEGYESDVEEDDNFSDGALSNYHESSEESDDEAVNPNRTPGHPTTQAKENRKLRTNEKSPMKEKVKHVSTRKFFGEDEEVYIMDAKSIGNLGRYLNHSCTPNMFVQNCFVDTHDLRFPWVSFFASTFIRAGQELCWDYGYVVDQVQGKEIYCECGADGCRGRLL